MNCVESIYKILSNIGQEEHQSGVVRDKDTPLYVQCLSGARSRQAAAYLGQMGYTNIKNIGGISAYRGKVEQ